MSRAPKGQGRVLITGAGRGLGWALCREFLDRGWSVLGLVRTTEAAEKLKELDPVRVRPIIGDVRDRELGAALAPALERAGGLEALINNAGIPGQGKTLEEADPEIVEALFQVHCLGALRCARAARPYLLAGRDPVILNISSRMASLGRNAERAYRDFRPSYAYRMVKAALNMLTVCLATDPSLEGVGAAAIHPGSLTTGMGYSSAQTSPEEAAARLADLVVSPPEGFNGSYLDLLTGERIPW